MIDEEYELSEDPTDCNAASGSDRVRPLDRLPQVERDNAALAPTRHRGDQPCRFFALGWEVQDSNMLYFLPLLVLGLLFLVPVGIAVFGGGRSRKHWDNLLIGLFAGSATVGLTTGWIAVVLIFIPEILASGVGLLAVLGGVISGPAAIIWFTRRWLRQ